MKITKKLIEGMHNNYEFFHCNTLEKAKELLQKAHDLGYKWYCGQSFLDVNRWNEYKENTCYNIYCGQYDRCEFYEGYEYKIVEYILDKDCGFTKDDSIKLFDTQNIISFYSIKNEKILIIKNVKHEEVYSINLVNNEISIFDEGENIVNDVCDEIISYTPISIYKDIVEKLYEPYKNVFINKAIENVKKMLNNNDNTIDNINLLGNLIEAKVYIGENINV